MTGFRLDPPFGRLIDRARPVTFRFEGRQRSGFAGDTIASALIADGQWLMARSFKYHRPRGPVTMTGYDANALVQVGNEPNVPADTHTIEDGPDVWPQNVAGSLDADRLRHLGLLSKFLPVGFYYRTFFRPRSAWRFWEPIIRRGGGLGRIDPTAPAEHGRYDKAYRFCDVAVIGGGPAGLSAALAAADAGAEVVLVERDPILGGSLNVRRFDAAGEEGTRKAAALIAAVTAHPAIHTMTATTCTGWFADHMLTLVQGDRYVKLRARRTIVATGAIGRSAVFRNNDLPGIVHGAAAQRLIRLWGVRPGSQAVVATCNGDGHGVALGLMDAGVTVAAVVELGLEVPPDPRRDAVRDGGMPVLRANGIVEARAAGNRIGGVVFDAGRPLAFDCDLLCLELGSTPAASLVASGGGTVAYSEAEHAMAVRALPDGMRVAGAVAGACDLETALAEGRVAGEGTAPPDGARNGPANHPWPLFPHPKGKEFVDLDEDLTVADIRNTVAEGFASIELAKRFSTVGMGPSQGRLSALNAVALAAQAAEAPLEGACAWTNRPPVSPEKLGLLAGRAFQPLRRTPMHHRHLEAGAMMMVAGAWLRPAYYGADGDTSIREEATAVRSGVGLIDVSTLGGIDIRGPDAAAFLNRLYTFAYAKQPVGRARYVLLLDETGYIVDDGVACRLADDHFYVTTTTGNSDSVYRAMLRWNAQWRLDVDIANVTAGFGGVNIAGPASRRVLARVTDLDLDAEAFPYLGVRQGTVAGIPCRVFRVGFVGELGYEVHMPASAGEALWDALLTAGAEDGIRPFGVEAQRLLRLEKGHIIIGQDTDGLTTPEEAQMAWAVARKKPFFVGGRSLDTHDRRGLERRLVGFALTDATPPHPAEGHLTLNGDTIMGHVTSVALSAAAGRVIGLAYVAPDLGEPGGRFIIKGPEGRRIEAEVVPLPFYDPDGARQEM